MPHLLVHLPLLFCTTLCQPREKHLVFSYNILQGWSKQKEDFPLHNLQIGGAQSWSWRANILQVLIFSCFNTAAANDGSLPGICTTLWPTEEVVGPFESTASPDLRRQKHICLNWMACFVVFLILKSVYEKRIFIRSAGSCNGWSNKWKIHWFASLTVDANIFKKAKFHFCLRANWFCTTCTKAELYESGMWLSLQM